MAQQVKKAFFGVSQDMPEWGFQFTWQFRFPNQEPFTGADSGLFSLFLNCSKQEVKRMHNRSMGVQALPWLGYLMLTLSCTPLAAGSFFDQFIDPSDGQFDTSAWLLDNQGFLPVPIIITEPAVGPGLGAAAVFFHGSQGDTPETPAVQDPGARRLAPSLSVLFGGATENETWFTGAAHRGIWKQDHIRYLAALARVSVNLSFYGSGEEEVNPDDGLDFNGDGWFLLQEIQFRIPDTDLFLGGRFDYVSADIQFDRGNEAPGLPPDQLGQTETAGLGLLLGYDSRDNLFTPNRGIMAEAEAMFHSGRMIGDFTYQKYKASSLFYWNPHPKWVLGWRLDGRFASGDIPFYALPYIDLRGIPALRYQGDDVLITEIEASWNLRSRWTLVGFTGVGRAEDGFSDLFDSGGDLRHTYGIGARYLIARRLGMKAGFDVARGPEETAFYLQVGGAWR